MEEGLLRGGPPQLENSLPREVCLESPLSSFWRFLKIELFKQAFTPLWVFKKHDLPFKMVLKLCDIYIYILLGMFGKGGYKSSEINKRWFFKYLDHWSLAAQIDSEIQLEPV